MGDIVPGSSAALAGLQPGDIIVHAGDTRINHTIDLLKQLDSRPERLEIKYERNGTIRETTLFIPYQENGEPNLGIVFQPKTYQSADVEFLGAFGKGFKETASTLSLTVKSLGMLFSGINVREAVSGPIRLTYYVGAIASAGLKRGIMAGFTNMFRFLSLLSVFFFLMNLLPIPALDGGHIVLHIIEGITKRKPKPALIYRYQIIGFTIIIGILIFSTFNDVSFFLGN